MAGFTVNSPARPHWRERGNMVITGRRPSIGFDFARGAPSIKTVLEGEATYETPDGTYKITPETFLILNADQEYALESPPGFPTHTFCLFFLPQALEDAAKSMGVRGLTGFYERLQLIPEGLTEPLQALRKIVLEGKQETMEGEEAFADVLMALVAVENGPREAESLAYSKSSAREEILRQLNRARDFALCNLSRTLSLEELSREAAMSSCHFHRLHRQAFGETPHEFVTRGRIARAKRLLRAGKEVEEVAIELGFESSPTFWRMFKAKTGQTPGLFRKIG